MGAHCTWTFYLVAAMCVVHPGTVTGFKILGFFPLDLYSHDVPFFNVFDELVALGHEVTLVSHFQLQHTSTAQYTHIQLPSVLRTGRHKVTFNLQDLNQSGFQLVRSFSDFCHDIAQSVNVPEIKNFIQNHRGEFDVIVSEITFCGHIHVALAHKYNASLVNFHPLGYASSQFSLLGALAPPGSTVDIRLPYTDLHQTLWQRANTFYIYLCDLWDVYSYYLPKMETLMVEVYKYPGSESRPPLLSLIHGISLTLVEYDPRIIGLSFPVPANVVLTGGLHLRPVRPLSPELEQFMQAPGKKGVIFVSLGTLLEFSHFGKEIIDAYAYAFRQLDYNVIWKLDVNITVPEHVMIGTWFPQEDILGHPNCKLFITHGGIHSAMETVYYAVPVVVMPGFSDQFQNAQLMEEKGIGLVALSETITRDSLYLNIHEVLNNTKYRSAVQRLSRQVHSLPYKNLNVAVQWIEYVAENHGAPGLSPETRHSSFWQILGFDLLLWALCFLLLLIIVFVLLVYCICCLCGRCGKRCSEKCK